MKTLIVLFALFIAVLWATPATAGDCAGSFAIVQQQFVPVQRNVIVQQRAFVPAFAAPAFVPARSFNLSINRGFAVAPAFAPVAVAPFRSFNLSINRGFAPAFAPRARFFR